MGVKCAIGQWTDKLAVSELFKRFFNLLTKQVSIIEEALMKGTTTNSGGLWHLR